MTNGRQRARILVVDDDPQILNLVCKMLELEDYEVKAVQNGEIAKSEIETNPPNLIITDVFMPDGDGLEILNAMRERSSVIPVIVMSGSVPAGDVNYLKFANRLGAFHSLPKPFRTDQLLSAVKSALEAR